MTPALDAAAAAIQAACAGLVEHGYSVSISMSPPRLKGDKGPVRCIVTVWNPPAADASQSQHAHAFGTDLADALKSALRGEHAANIPAGQRWK